MIVSVLLIVLATLAGSTTSVHYHIVPVNATSLCKGYPNGTCFTLKQLSSEINATGNRNITISFLPGEHLLDWKMSFVSSEMNTMSKTHNGLINTVTLNSEQLDNTSSNPVKIMCTLPNAGISAAGLHTFTVQGLMIYGCKRDTYGGAISVTGGNVFITETHFINNHVMSEYNEGSGGAIYLSNANVMILNSVFTNNTAFVMTLIGDVNSMSCKFKHFSVFGGGAINLLTSNVSIHGCDFDSNTAKCGGALIINSLGSHTNISNTTFRGNYAEQGGAIYNYNVKYPLTLLALHSSIIVQVVEELFLL